MTTQNYCMVNKDTNVCDNIISWDGNPQTWQPPTDQLMLVQATTLAKVWEWDEANLVWVLGIQTGVGQIGFTWDGAYLTTNAPEPDPLPPPPVQGAQVL